jgi:hypothetical protein
MNWAKVSAFGLLVALGLALSSNCAWADDAGKTITGKASCGHCSGVVKGGCCVMLTDSAGDHWILRGDSKDLKTAFTARKSGKSMTATYAGEPTTKKGEDGKDYKEVKVKDVKISS